ncbi:MAG: hypothetical protein BroJett025_08030 [Patescibacteria group bacterium]|nr:MAG: hypothetical protein BroJett025_08030 [Patescibacteria group bacterium]
MDFFDIFYQYVYPFELQIIFKLIFAFIVGGIMGYTRTMSGKPAGIRTQMLLCVGSTLLTAISIHLKDIYVSPNADPARLMAQIVTGIGFVGGGVILKSDRKVLGVTTAAMIWVAAAMGIAIGSGFYLVSLAMLGFVLLLEPIAKLQFIFGLKSKPYVLSIKTKNLNRVLTLMKQLAIREQAQEAENGDTTIYLLSSYQKNSQLEELLAKKRINFKLKKINTQDFE